MKTRIIDPLAKHSWSIFNTRHWHMIYSSCRTSSNPQHRQEALAAKAKAVVVYDRLINDRTQQIPTFCQKTLDFQDF